jgi:YD repeat-containing protein
VTKISYLARVLGCHVYDQPQSITDPAGRVTTLQYDNRERLVKIIAPNNSETLFSYNARGDRQFVVDPDGNQTGFVFDQNGRLITETRASAATVNGKTYPASAVSQYQWDAVDHLISQTKVSATGGPSRVVTMSYDPIGRLIEKTLTTQSGNNVLDTQDVSQYTYTKELDAIRMIEADNDVAKLGFTFEAVPPFANLSYAVSATDTNNELNLLQNTYSITPDITSQIASVADSHGTIFSAQYDQAARLLELQSNYFSGHSTLSFTEMYDGFGRKRGQVASTGLVSSYSWDSLNRPVSRYSNFSDGESKLAHYQSDSDGLGNPRPILDRLGVAKHTLYR